MNKTIEMVHPNKYADAVKIAQKFTSKSNIRMVLQLVYHRKDGDLIATDSHHLIKIKGAHGFNEDYLVNTKSLEFAKGQFPETDNIMPTEFKSVIRLNQDQIKIWLQMHRSMNQMTKLKTINESLSMKLTEETIHFEFKNKEITFKLPYEEFEYHPEVTSINYSVELMRNALEAHEKLQSKELYISISSPFRLILLDNGGDVQALVLPVRTY